MTEPHYQAFFVNLRCGCGAALFVDAPTGTPYKSEFFELAAGWTKAHADCSKQLALSLNDIADWLERRKANAPSGGS